MSDGKQSNPTGGYWELTIVAARAEYHVIGTEPVLQAAVSEWQDWLDNGARDDHERIEVGGMTDSVDRADLTTIVVASTIEGMTLKRLYG